MKSKINPHCSVYIAVTAWSDLKSGHNFTSAPQHHVECITPHTAIPRSPGCCDTPSPWIWSTHTRNTSPTARIFFLTKLAFAEEIPPLSGDQLHLWSRVTAEEEATLQVTFCLVSLCPWLGCWAFRGAQRPSRIPGWFRTAVDLREKYFPRYLHECSQSQQPTFGRELVGWFYSLNGAKRKQHRSFCFLSPKVLQSTL